MSEVNFNLPKDCEIRWNSLTRGDDYPSQDEVLIDLPSGKSIDVGFYNNNLFRVVVYQNRDFHDQVEWASAKDVDEVIKLVEDYAVKYS